MPASGRDLVAIARLRSDIAVLARGGEYTLASARLLALAALDLRVGLRADAFLRARQAAEIASDRGDLVHELQAGLTMALAQLETGDAVAAEAAADAVLYRSGGLADHLRRQIVTSAYLVRGMASRRRGAMDAARVALDQARLRAVPAGRPDLTALSLAELGLLDLATGDPAGAAICFTFARDAFRLAGRDAQGRTVELLALDAFIAGGRTEEAIAQATAARADATARGDAEVAARATGVLADALIARGDLAAAAEAAGEAAVRAQELPAGTARELDVRARLRLAALATDPAVVHHQLEAAVDLGVASRDAALAALVLDAVVGGILAGRLPVSCWALVDLIAAGCHAAGLSRLAAVAEAALAELR
ncbi:MAG: hypothetical protein R3B06_30815 [Kofleriaceae bacterium]